MRRVETQSVSSFLDGLASASPAPGGGAAAGVTAALGIALVEMTAAINARRAKRSLSKNNLFSRLRRDALRAVHTDAQAFLALNKLRGVAKDSARYQTALRRAAEAPASLIALCEKALVYAAREAPRTSRWLASDLAEAVLLLEAAAEAARLNVDINLSLIRNDGYIRRMSRAQDLRRRRVAALSKAVLKGLPR